MRAAEREGGLRLSTAGHDGRGGTRPPRPGPFVAEEALRGLLGELELDAVVAALPVSVLALSGYRCSFERAFRRSMHGAASDPARQHASFAVVTADGERTLVVDALFAPTAGDRFGRLETYGGIGALAWRPGEIDRSLEALAPPPRAADAIEVLALVLRERRGARRAGGGRGGRSRRRRAGPASSEPRRASSWWTARTSCAGRAW